MIVSILEDCLNKDIMLLCAVCGNTITAKSKLCKVPGAEGEIGAYVNPHG